MSKRLEITKPIYRVHGAPCLLALWTVDTDGNSLVG